jgi:hypothetical protein
MAPRRQAFLILCMLVLAVGGPGLAEKKSIDRSKMLVVQPFTSEVKGAAGLPEAVRDAIIQTFKDEKAFAAVLTPQEAADKDKASLLELNGKLVDFAAGNAAKRMLVGFGSGRANATFEFTVTDLGTSQVIWQKAIKQSASFWFSSYTSSAAERAELPYGLATKLLKEMLGKQPT